MAFGVDTNPRFVLFSIIASGIFTYIVQKMNLLTAFTLANPLFSWIEFMIVFAIFLNIVYVLATYENEENENINRAYIAVIVALIISAIALYFIGPIITSLLG